MGDKTNIKKSGKKNKTPPSPVNKGRKLAKRTATDDADADDDDDADKNKKKMRFVPKSFDESSKILDLTADNNLKFPKHSKCYNKTYENDIINIFLIYRIRNRFIYQF